MKADIRKRWVEALRSGEYAQGTGALRTEIGYCCLGVLVDLYVTDGHSKWNINHDLDDEVSYDVLNEGAHLPDKVVEWAELNSCDPFVEVNFNDYGKASLAELNDGDFTFAEIANLIEEQL